MAMAQVGRIGPLVAPALLARGAQMDFLSAWIRNYGSVSLNGELQTWLTPHYFLSE